MTSHNVHGTPTARRILGAAAALATLPYVTMKIAWLTGNPVGVTDPRILEGAGMPVMNAITVLLDLCVVALAVALGSRTALRFPVLPVLLPAWVATGLLVPIALVSLPMTLVLPPATATGMATWVHPMVYGGFTVQGVCLLTAFALLARDRWGARVTTHHRAEDAARPLLRALAGGGAVTAAVAAGLRVVGGWGSGDPVVLVPAVVTAVLIVIGVAGIVGLTAGRPGWPVAVAAWVGSAVAFADGLYATATTMGATELAVGGGSPATGVAHVAGLLAGFALAVAGLLSMSRPGAALPGAGHGVPDEIRVQSPVARSARG
ncbi:hypothetical protein Ae168Ps1_0367c [Pseudonocardia sp. Ae168_Ps1]|uniref:hypothetical protein n=1 Tax=unclassified Pseudonocardia TaxID=2619320 RepID=UPI00094B142D|nr:MULTISPECIES: hypothetical protein [unclassified Pseudonocardia]OLL71994.1 hypothetical protein Ae150APs1_0372c [Pseudonocardia sp. Ae150A_Ps1]OLL77961.1 hypothetical protein Ae168Ps1_0367c [Pseudonocardia sp. Ae168_Ps1]OLL87916.1 hypothetical protein Ae263Ps1_4971 [Pseudonocardia sp. Ae263_Ps1]OLL92059.1 hypothetical protein Ae356Ps1_1956c [Pseudonocardia sp. Ae356_Ps1]